MVEIFDPFRTPDAPQVFDPFAASADGVPGPRGPRPEDTAAGRLIMRNPNLRAVVEAGAAEVPFPQGTGRGNDLLPIVNQGAIAGTLGLPVDMVNSVLRMAGVPVSDRPIGGSASIEAGMARAGQAANTPMVPEVGFTPQTPQQYMARGVGQALGMLNPTILAGRLAAAVGGPVASRVGQTIAQAPVRSPIMVPATEVAAGAGGGFGRAIAEQNYPGNEPVAMLGELAGGVTGGVVAQAPSLLARTPGVATAIDAAKSVLPSGARGRAAERISSLVEDPYAASRAAVAPTISDLTPAQRTGEAGLLELERAVAAENPAIARQLRERAEAAQAALLAEARTLGGRPEDTRAFLEDRVTRLTTALNTRVEQAQTEANRRIAALEPGAPAADASRIVREEFDRAFTAARAQENALWQALPQDLKIDTAPLFERFAALVDATPRTQRQNIPAFARQFLGREAPDEQTDAVMSQLNTLYPGAFPPQPSQRLGATASPAELQGLRSELLEIQRAARKAGRRNEARIAGEIADDVLTSLNSLPETGGPYDVAREFSRNVNEVFREGGAAPLARRTGGGEAAVAPELTLETLLGRGGPRADIAARDLLVATGDSPATRQAIEDYLTQSFRNTAVSGEGRLKPESATNWMRRNAALLDRFPEVRNQLAEAMTAQGRAETLTTRQTNVERGLLRRDDSRVERLLDQRPESAVARFLNAAPGKEVDRVFSADDPAALAASLRRSVDRDQTGQALSGLRGAFIDNLLGRARQTTAEGPVFQGSAIVDALNDPKQVAALGAVFDAPAMQRLRQIGTELTALERARAARPATGGVVEDIPSKVLDFVGRVVAGQFVSGLQETAMATGAMRSFLKSMTTDRAQRLLSQAVTDPELFATLMSPLSTPRQQDAAVRRLQGFLAGSAGRAVTGEEEDRQPAPNAMAPAGASGNVNAMAR
jgi:hypothetical protein